MSEVAKEDDARVITASVTRKVRESLRDMLCLKYGKDWRAHDRFSGQFWTVPTETEKRLHVFLMAWADNDPEAVLAVERFSGEGEGR